jgi:deaminated glutathione amidase
MTAVSEFRAGVVQLCSGCDVDRNLKDASLLVREAQAKGAEFIATPEMTNILDTDRERVSASVEEERNDRAPRLFSELAHELGIYLLIGSMALRTGAGKLVNRSLLFSPEGKVAARYDKIHMFDVELGSGQSFRESRSYQAGETAELADLPWARLGLTICYDVRFPQLYRSLTRAGAYMISVPSAFTQKTGADHWEVLMRARAIENAVFIIAPAQTGRHECGRQTYGHSLVVDPWGEVMCDLGQAPGIAIATISPHLLVTMRQRIPLLQHARPAGLYRSSGPAGIVHDSL